MEIERGFAKPGEKLNVHKYIHGMQIAAAKSEN